MSQIAQQPLALDILFEDPALRIVICENCMAAVWRDVPSVEHLRRMQAEGERLEANYPDKVFVLNIIRDGTPRFSDDVRKQAAAQTRERAGHILATAHIVRVYFPAASYGALGV